MAISVLEKQLSDVRQRLASFGVPAAAHLNTEYNCLLAEEEDLACAVQAEKNNVEVGHE